MIKAEKRVFICSEQKFPYGSAGANYILYLGKCLIESGYNVKVLGFGEHRDIDYIKGDKFEVQGIEYKSLQEIYKQYSPFLLYNIIGGKLTVLQLREWSIQDEDIVIIYSKNAEFILPILRLSKENIGIKVLICVVEWYGQEQFRGGKISLSYWLYNFTFHAIIPKVKNVIAISSCLQTFFEKKGCSVLRLPVMTEIKHEIIRSNNHNNINFIYSGRVGRKDEVKMMLRTFVRLSNKERVGIKFHFTGERLEIIKKSFSVSEWEEMKEIIVVHGWLDYNKLLELYVQMDFLLILRKETRFTQANFPSKIPETMRQGIIPIINNVGDYTKNYLEHGVNAILMKECTEDACLDAVREAISLDKETKIRMREMCYETVRLKFDYHNWNETIDEFLQTIK